MTVHFDSSILVAALVDSDPNHGACLDLLKKGGASIFVHALTETFDIITGGPMASRVLPSIASEVLAVSVIPRVRAIALTTAAFGETEKRGVRGRAIYDGLPLVALCLAREARGRELVAARSTTVSISSRLERPGRKGSTLSISPDSARHTAPAPRKDPKNGRGRMNRTWPNVRLSATPKRRRRHGN